MTYKKFLIARDNELIEVAEVCQDYDGGVYADIIINGVRTRVVARLSHDDIVDTLVELGFLVKWPEDEEYVSRLYADNRHAIDICYLANAVKKFTI